MTEGDVEPGRFAKSAHRRLAQLFMRWLPAIFIVAGAIGLWEGVVVARDIPDWKLPAPSGIGNELWDSRSLLLDHTWVTLKEALAGFGIALGVGIVLSGLIILSRTLERVIYPLVHWLLHCSLDCDCPPVDNLGRLWDAAQGYGGSLHLLFPNRGEYGRWAEIRRPGHDEPFAYPGSKPVADVFQSPGAKLPAFHVFRREDSHSGQRHWSSCGGVGRLQRGVGVSGHKVQVPVSHRKGVRLHCPAGRDGYRSCSWLPDYWRGSLLPWHHNQRRHRALRGE